MKIALICPSNMLYMPYVNNYEIFLKEKNVDYDLITWDRFHLEELNHNLVYRDNKKGHRRNFIDYYRYKNFITSRLKRKRYEKVIVFGIQLAFFLNGYLLNKYKGNYVIDIRDHNNVKNLFNISKLIYNSSFVVLSSPGYKEWLPSSTRYIINHNTQIADLSDLKKVDNNFSKNNLVISNIGALRDYKVNIAFINSLKNNKKINLKFHGEGIINKSISNYLKENDVENVLLMGRYEKLEEDQFYKDANLINVFRYNDGVNNNTALPNRLYNAANYGKPVIGIEGTYLAEEIKKYKLGLIVNSFNDIEREIYNYIDNFDIIDYETNRISFFKEVIEDNMEFKRNLCSFVEK